MNIFKISIGLFYLHNIEKRFNSLEEAKQHIFDNIEKYTGLSVVISEHENINDEPLHAWFILKRENEPRKYLLLDNDDIFSEDAYRTLCLEQPNEDHTIHKTIYIDYNKSYMLDFIEIDKAIMDYIKTGIKASWIIG